jgi:hypothetical protein
LGLEAALMGELMGGRSLSRLDEVLPEFNVSKIYRLRVAAAPERVYRAVEEYDPRGSPVLRFLMAVRGYGRRVSLRSGSAGLVASLESCGFVSLGGREGRELVFGLAGRFWRPDGSLRALTAEEFLAFSEDGWAKAAWNISAAPDGTGATLLHTETRVLCFGARARRLFRIYWSTIEMFSGAIRMSMLRGIRRKALSTGGEA